MALLNQLISVALTAFVRGGVGGGVGRGARCALSSRYAQKSSIKVGLWYRSKGQPILWRVWCGM